MIEIHFDKDKYIQNNIDNIIYAYSSIIYCLKTITSKSKNNYHVLKNDLF